MINPRAFVKTLKFKPKIEKLTKEEMEEASARAEAFSGSLNRFRAFSDAPTAEGWAVLSQPHAYQILNAATRGFRFVSIPHLTAAIDRSRMLRAQYPGAALVDKSTRLTGNDLAFVTSAAALALGRAISISAKEQKARRYSMACLSAGSAVIVLFIGMVISGR